MMRASTRYDFVNRWLPVAGRSQFLESGLGMLRRAALAGQILLPGIEDELAGLLHAGVEKERTDQGFDHVTDDIVAIVCAVGPRLLADADERRKAEVAANVGAGLARDQGVVTARHLALGLVRISLIQRTGDDQAENPVAKEFEALVTVGAGARMGEGPLKQGQVGGRMTELVADEGGDVAAHFDLSVYPLPMRLARRAVNQVHGRSHEALPSVDQKVTVARPTIFSTGSMPTPPTAGEKRLSSLLSRLSPIRNTMPAGTSTAGKSSPEPFST